VVISLAISAAGSEVIALWMPPMRDRRRYERRIANPMTVFCHRWPTVCIEPKTEPPGASRFPATRLTASMRYAVRVPYRPTQVPSLP